MNYVKIYRQLVLKRRQNPIYKNPENPNTVHYHHVFPISCGGTPDKASSANKPGSNLIGLTRKEHFLAHHLLKKICEKSKFANNMNYAFRMMCGLVRNQKWNEVRVSAKVYDKACNDAAINRGRHLTEEHKAKIREALRKPEARERARQQSKNRKYDATARKHMSEAQQKRRDQISKQFKGKPKSEEQKRKMSISQQKRRDQISKQFKGKHLSEEHKMKISLHHYRKYVENMYISILLILIVSEKL